MYTLVTETTAYEGVARIATKIAADFEAITTTRPFIVDRLKKNTLNIVFATIGHSEIIEDLVLRDAFDPSGIVGKREVFTIQFVDEHTLLIAGSDKRGTIYGMFTLSEYIGVSPLHFWGDAIPVVNKGLIIGKDIEQTSKEPSVTYRGLFINDEWPCFGNWTFGKFGGFTAEMYDHVFELILRLKGNYLWPAMWTSSFSLDGPGQLSEELADIYGVVIGASHHEPCLRASEEWAKVRGEDTPYGTAWNYLTNKEGLNNYWRDGLKRSGQYEKIITIGMRGEYDSAMMAEATLEDNINILKDIITNQRTLIDEHVENKDNPLLLAVYKEVEEYFYGAEGVQGLKDWEGLDDVICMLCEDNFGFMRSLPNDELRQNDRKFGMYYHFDYHGGPISYEWLPSTTFERTWEQMSMAYDYGVRDVWIVNCGDLKFNEVQLNYFMNMAYDFDKWGTTNLLSPSQFTETFVESHFKGLSTEEKEDIATVLKGYMKLNAQRRPEALNADIYHATHYLEVNRILAQVARLKQLSIQIFDNLPKAYLEAYYSMVHFPAMASLNLIEMHAFATKNHHYARQGKKIANAYAEDVKEAIDMDHKLAVEFGNFRNGKWKGMELAPHVGFTTWNEDNHRYPVRHMVHPVAKPRMVVSRKDRGEIYHKTYGKPMEILVEDFLYAGNELVIIEIANDGEGDLKYEITNDSEWLKIRNVESKFTSQNNVGLYVDHGLLTHEISETVLTISDGDTKVNVRVRARNVETAGLPEQTYLQDNGVYIIEPDIFFNKQDAPDGKFVELLGYGRSGMGFKVYPTTAAFEPEDIKPTLSYRVLIEEAGDYVVEVWSTPTNPVAFKKELRFMLNDEVMVAVDTQFSAGSPYDKVWSQGVLDNIRKTPTTLSFDKGVQEIHIAALDPNFILERVLVYKKGKDPLPSYLGPVESFYVQS